MYDQAIAPNATKSENPVLITMLERFEKQNSWQREIILQVEDRLHGILNRRNEAKPERGPEPQIGDFAQAMSKQLSMMEENCNKIEAILGHLRMIA